MNSAVTDRRGVPVSYPDAGAVAAFENAHDLFLTFGGDPLESIEGVIEEHPDFILAHLFKAGYLTQILETRVHDDLVEAIATADNLTANANERELAHLSAVKAWARGDVFGATAEWERALQHFPHDLLAMQLVHLSYVLFGEIRGQRNVVASVFKHWDASIVGYEFVLGFYSFGLEENFEFDQAIEMAMRSLAIREHNPYAIHTIAHVRDMRGQAQRGLDFMYEYLDTWNASEFAVHLWWHTALLHLELQEFDKALAIYDDRLRSAKGDSSRYEEFDATALLWRLKLLDVDVGDRWKDLADKWEPSAEDVVYAFNNVHAMMALVSDDRVDACEKLLASSSTYSRKSSHATAKAIRNVGLPFCKAIWDFQCRRYDDCANRLLPVRADLDLLGGSFVQRDVLNWTLLEAANRDGNVALSASLSDERGVSCRTRRTRAVDNGQ